MLSYSTKPARLNTASADISGIEEIMTVCSYVVGSYRKLGNNQQTRLTMRSIFVSLESHVANIVKNLRMAIPKVSGAIGANMPSFIMALSLYELIDACQINYVRLGR